MKPTSTTGAVFITTGSLTGASISSTIGGIGIAGSFGALGVGTTAITATGAVAGAAMYGAFKGIIEGDRAVFGAMGIGAISGVGFSSVFGGIGLVAPKIGLAYGVGSISMAGIGTVVGLAAYGVAKLLDDSEFQETPMQVFERMEEKVLQIDYYNTAVIELNSFLSGEDLHQKFAALEVEEDLEKLKDRINSNSPKIETKTVSLANKLPQSWQCVKTLKGHTGKVNTVAIHPDADTLISGSNDRQVNLWNLKTGKCLYTFYGQAEAVLSVAISPDGKQIISGSVDRKISGWQLDTKQYNYTLSYLNSPYSHNGFVNTLVYNRDGNIIASGSADKTIRIWGGYTRSIKRTFNGHTDAVLAVVISPDSTTLVSASADKTIRIWNLQTGQQLYIITQHLAAVNTLAITPNNQFFVSGSTDTTIKLWNMQTKELIRTLMGHLTAVESVAIHPDGQTLASSDKNGIIKLWNLETGELLETFSGFNPLAFSSDGKTLISGGKSGTIKIWRQVQSTEYLPIAGEWWEILGVNTNTHPQEVKLAYRRLARLYHPDINNSEAAKAAMQAVNQAYHNFQTLVNIEKSTRL